MLFILCLLFSSPKFAYFIGLSSVFAFIDIERVRMRNGVRTREREDEN